MSLFAHSLIQSFGSVNQAYDNLALTVPDLNWIEVFPRDVDTKDRVQLEAEVA